MVQRPLGPTTLFKHLLLWTNGRSKQILCGSLLVRGKQKFILMIQVTWPQSKMLKTLKNLLLQNHLANCLETWHVASESVVLQSIYKSWHLVDLDLFYRKVNFGSMAIWMGKAEIFHFCFVLFWLLFNVPVNNFSVMLRRRPPIPGYYQYFWGILAQGNNTPTRPRIEPGSPDPESNALTTRPVRPLFIFVLLLYS